MESQGSKLGRSARESRPVSRLKPNMSGKSYLQRDDKTKKKVMFAEDKTKTIGVLQQPGIASETREGTDH
jgi:hypothetical protein